MVLPFSASGPLPPVWSSRSLVLTMYEVMFGDEVKTDGVFEYDKRRENAETYFEQFEKDRSLIFYYANYSSPLNQDERRYAIVGLSRIKSIGKIRYFQNCSERVKEKYAGG